MYLQQMSDGSPISPEDMMSAAQAIADDLLGRPEADKNMKLRQLRENKPPLHQLVRSAMDQKKRQAKSQAGSQAMAQPQPGGQPPA